MSIGIPVKLLHEAEGHIVTCELKTGEVYRGKLQQAEDNMNLLMLEVTLTNRDGSTAPLQSAYLRGSQVRYMILPDMLKNAPFFRKDLPPRPAEDPAKARQAAQVKTNIYQQRR